MRAAAVADPDTVHGSLPSFTVLAAISVGNVVPPSVESSIFTFPVRFVELHVSVWDDPMAQISPPSGEVTVIVGCTIVKFALLMSVAEGTVTPVIRIRAPAVAGPATVHASEPSFAVVAAMTVGNVDPPSVESAIVTFPVKFVDVHVSVCNEPIAQPSPPFGERTVMVGWTTVKLALLISSTEGMLTLDIRIRAVELAGPDTVHGSVPSFAVFALSVVGNVAPPSVERSILTLPGRFAEAQVSVCDDPIGQLSPPFGDVTVIVGCTMLKFALLLSRTVGSDTLRILTLAVADTGPVTVQGSEPSFVVLANSVVGNVVPPSVERSIFTVPLTPLDVQVIV